jgi:hypothetical protein
LPDRKCAGSHAIDDFCTLAQQEKRRELPSPARSLIQGPTNKHLGFRMQCAQESGLIDENTQSDWRMIVSSDKILSCTFLIARRQNDAAPIVIDDSCTRLREK